MMPPRPPSELRQALAELRPFFIRACGFSLASAVLVLSPSVYMLEVYERVVNSRNHMTLLMLTVLVLGAYVLMEVLDWARSEIMHDASLALDRKLGDRVFQALFRAGLRSPGGGTVQPMNDFRTVREFLYSPVLLAIMESPVALLCMALLFAISPVLGWSAVVGGLLQGVIAWLNERDTKPALTAANRHAIQAQQYADGSLRNAEVIESMGMLRDIHRRWMEKQTRFLQLQAQGSQSAGLFQALTKLVQITMGSLLLGLGAWLLLQDDLNGGPGMMIVGSILGGRALAPLVQIVGQWRNVVNCRDAWGRLDQLLADHPPRPPAMPLPPPRGRLQVEQLLAPAPGTNTPIIRGVAFNLQPGEVLAVVGPSAAGKTSLAKLLVGLWPAASGKVRLDGVDVYHWDKAELGPHLGYLPQGVELFDGTVAENIARFGEVEPHKVEAAARAVGLHEFILALPQGYETQIGRDGATLSGGQRQRVALARAIYGDPVLVVLDEPNSSLDEEGDAALASMLRDYKARGTTFVVMTHRTSVLSVADKMLVMREGTMHLFGPVQEVLAALRRGAAQQGQPQPAQATPLVAPAA